MTKFIAIISGKGGVGKTTTAINLGAALSSFGKEVLVLDGNVKTPNVGLYLGVSKFPFTVHNALKGEGTLRDSVYMHSSGLKFLPGSISFEDASLADTRGMPQLLLDLYGVADIVLVDSPAGIGNEVRDVIRASDEILVVTNPTIPAVTDALKAVNTARENNTKIYGVVVSRAGGDDNISKEGVSSILSVPALEQIPEDNNIQKSLLLKQPVVFSHPDSSSSTAYKKLAAGILGQQFSPSLKRKGFFARLFSKKQ